VGRLPIHAHGLRSEGGVRVPLRHILRLGVKAMPIV
jgi:hypothetical protein